MILIELTAAIDAAGTLKTFYVGDEDYVTSPTDTPANTVFVSRLKDPGTIGLHAFSDGRTGGGTKLEIGEITLANPDGGLDDWVNYSFDGRPVVIRSGNGGSYPADFPVVFRGTLDGLTAPWDKIVLRLRDKQRVLDKALLTTVYLGNNVAPDGVEGTKDDLKGKVKPRFWGKVTNPSPPCVNTSKLVYEVGTCLSIDKVYDKGAELIKGADYTSYSDMMTNAPAASNFRAWPAGGYFRLGSNPVGQITFDGTEGATAADRTTGQILKRVALHAGVASGEISATDVTTLDAANSAVVGVWVDGTTTSKAVMDSVAASIGAWYGFDQAGVLRMARLTAPSGTPVVTLTDYDCDAKIERRAPKDTGIPAYRVDLKHSKIWTVQVSDLASSVSSNPARAAFLAEDFRVSTATDTAVQTQWLLSEPIEFETLLTSATDADAEAARRLELHKVRRDIYEVRVSISILTAFNLRFMDVIRLQLPRYNLLNGRDFRLIGMALNLKDSRVALTLWG